MKGITILIIIACSLTVSVLLHAFKVKNDDELDKIELRLAGAKKALSPQSSVSFIGEPSKAELWSWARYAMVPVHLQVVNPGTVSHDTTLSIQYLVNSDSALDAFISPRKVLWQTTDSMYVYKLTTP